MSVHVYVRNIVFPDICIFILCHVCNKTSGVSRNIGHQFPVYNLYNMEQVHLQLRSDLFALFTCAGKAILLRSYEIY